MEIAAGTDSHYQNRITTYSISFKTPNPRNSVSIKECPGNGEGKSVAVNSREFKQDKAPLYLFDFTKNDLSQSPHFTYIDDDKVLSQSNVGTFSHVGTLTHKNLNTVVGTFEYEYGTDNKCVLKYTTN